MGGRGPMGHGMAGGMPGDKAKNFKGTLKKLLSYLSRYKLALLLVVVCAIASTVFAIVGPTILGNATTEIFKGLVSKVSGGDGIDFDTDCPLRSQRLVFLYPGAYYDPDFPENDLSYA